jgi:hypothetical protein
VRKLKSMTAMLLFLLAHQAAAQAPESVRLSVFIGSFKTEGLAAKVETGLKKKIIEDLSALNVNLHSQPLIGEIEESCFDSPDCLRKTVDDKPVSGVLDIQVSRLGPRVRTIVRYYGAATGKLLIETKTISSARGFPAAATFGPDIKKGIKVLRRLGPPKVARADPPIEKPDPKVEPKIEPKVEPKVRPLTKLEPEVKDPGSDPIVISDQSEPGLEMSTWGWLVVGAGGALLISGVITGGVALALDGDLADACPGGNCPPERFGDMDKLERLSTATNVLISVGAAGAVVGVLLLTVFDDDDPANNISLKPTLGPDYAGALIQGRF